ncbi:hypothetical protein [Lunatimonas salinarum]|uniref:hypothetical protein n=1 Tax=Lunatimonas salinarum TaxID=1774590 RepID=UPI001AE0665B|nr:hypothetical protein [Lunatimonas salinarum]
MTKLFNYFIVFLGLFGLIQHNASACDACGCALGGFNFGIIPQNEAHFVGLKYSRANFYADMMHGGNLEYSNDLYQRMDFMGRIALKERLQLNIVLPYMHNQMDGSHEKAQLSGLGDPMAILNYKIIDQKGNPMEAWLHNLWIGGGIKSPLANFEYSQTEQLINPNFQLGSGSWDYLASANYTSMRNRWGINLEAVYKVNAANPQNYRFGNQYNMQASAFYMSRAGNTQFIPIGGIYHEYGGQHTFEGFYQSNSGGKLTMAQIGLQVQSGTWMLHGNYQSPLSQHFNSDLHVNIESKGRLSFTLVKFIGNKSNNSIFEFK